MTLRIFEGAEFREIGAIIGSSEGAARVNYPPRDSTTEGDDGMNREECDEDHATCFAELLSGGTGSRGRCRRGRGASAILCRLSWGAGGPSVLTRARPEPPPGLEGADPGSGSGKSSGRGGDVRPR